MLLQMLNDELKKIKKEVKGAWLPFIIYTRVRGGRNKKGKFYNAKSRPYEMVGFLSTFNKAVRIILRPLF